MIHQQDIHLHLYCMETFKKNLGIYKAESMTGTSMLFTYATIFTLHKAIIACAQVGSKSVHAGGALGTRSIDKAFVHICMQKEV